MTKSTVGTHAPLPPIPTLGIIYSYALMFHLVLPWLAYFLTKEPQAGSLAEELLSPRWQIWPSPPLTAWYGVAWACGGAAACASLWVPRRILAQRQDSASGDAGQTATLIRRMTMSYMLRVGLLELLSLTGFVVAFHQKMPGIAVPFSALGFLMTLVLPPTRYHLTQFVAAAVSLLTLVMVVGACVTIPESGRSQLVAIPDGYMNQMGEKAFSEMKAKEKISHDTKVNAAIVEIGERIARASQKKYDWEFTVFDSKEVNAFCLPGGKVGVYTGLLPIAKTNAGLAAVMGHEVAHAVAHHGAERATQSLIVSGTLLSVEKVIQDPKYRQLAMAALGVGVQFGVVLPFSRNHESEADAIGLIYMARAGYDPEEAVKLWERMGAAGSRPPEWLSTHPDPTNRAKDLARKMSKAKEIYEKSQKVPTTAL